MGEFLLQEGYCREEIFTSLEQANGDLDDALLFLHRSDRSTMTRTNTSLSSKDGMSESHSASAPSSNSTSYSHSLEPLPETPPARREEPEPPKPSHHLMVKRLSSQYRKTSFCDDVKNLGKITISPRKDEFDYTVVFNSVPLGFEIHPCASNRNGCIGKRLNDFSKENVYKGSLILACNDVWLLGQSTKLVQDCIKGEAKQTPV